MELPDDGRIVISRDEVMQPIHVENYNMIQCPEFKLDSLARLYISRHGDMNKTWITITADTLFAIIPPYYIYSKYPCVVPAIKL